MKKLMTIGIVLVLLLTVVACETEQKFDVDIETFFISESVALTLEMHEFADDDEYVAYMMQAPEVKNIIENIASTDYSLPEKAYIYKYSNELVVNALMSELGDEAISDEVMDMLSYKFNGSMFANLINGQQGSETLAATATTTWGKSYIEPEGFEENVIIILEYPGDFSSLISFSSTGEGVIGGISSFVANGAVDYEDLLSELTPMEKVDVKVYSKEELEKFIGKVNE